MTSINFQNERIGEMALKQLISLTEEKEKEEEEKTQEEKENLIKLIDKAKNSRRGYYKAKKNQKERETILNFIKV